MSNSGNRQRVARAMGMDKDGAPLLPRKLGNVKPQAC